MFWGVGFAPKWVGVLLLVEGSILAVLGTVVGVGAGAIYTKVMIYGLGTVWQGAVGGSAIHFGVEASSVFAGAGGGLLVSFVAIWLALRKQFRQPARELLGRVQGVSLGARGGATRSKTGLWVAVAAVIGAVVRVTIMGEEKSGAFFGAGALLLIAEIGIASTLLQVNVGGKCPPMCSLWCL